MKKRQLKIPLEMGVLMVTDQQKMDFSVFKKLPKFLWGYSSPIRKEEICWFAAAPLVSNVCDEEWGYIHIYPGNEGHAYSQGITNNVKNWRGAREMARNRGVYEQEP